MQVLSTNIAVPRPSGVRRYATTGIDKRSAPQLTVTKVGPDYGDGSAAAQDFIGDSEHHGGADKALYAFAREELDYWEHKLERTLNDGCFGENLTTSGIDWTTTLINQRVHIGEVILEVSIPRQPCATFAAWMDIKGWVKTFTQRGDCGAYLRVIEPGTIEPGAPIELGPEPEHGITMGTAFAAKMGNKKLAEQVYNSGCMPAAHQDNYRP